MPGYIRIDSMHQGNQGGAKLKFLLFVVTSEQQTTRRY